MLSVSDFIDLCKICLASLSTHSILDKLVALSPNGVLFEYGIFDREEKIFSQLDKIGIIIHGK